MKTLPVQFGEAAANVKIDQDGLLPTFGEIKELSNWANSIANVRVKSKGSQGCAKRPYPVLTSPETMLILKAWRELMGSMK